MCPLPVTEAAAVGSKQEGQLLDDADSRDAAWAKAHTYTEMLRKAGLAGKWSVRAEHNATHTRERTHGRTGGGTWRVMLYDEREADDKSDADLLGLLRLKGSGHRRL